MTHKNSHQYRSDIDGLRAIAVIPVVIFHAFPMYFTGGYIGVDVFFVISGYLITSIITSKVKKGNFSFVDFYSRRIRRIYPALLMVVVSCLILGYFALFSNEYKQLAKHVAGSSVFISNFILLFESGYFDTASITKPLLHLWSLSIEEQFYIIWPLVIYVSFKLRANILKIVSLFLVCSFVYNIYEIQIDQSADFYLPFTRFWELNVGSVLAIVISEHNSRFIAIKATINSKFFILKKIGGIESLCSIIGILALLYGYLTFNQAIKFPGFYALVPVLSAFLLILAGRDTFVNKHILSAKILVWIGLISYPIYLWHWPLLSFAYIINSGYPPTIICIGLICLAILLSWLTYYFVERNVRYGKKTTRITIILFVLLLVTGGVGLYIYNHNGLESRFKNNIAEIKDNQNLKARLDEETNKCSKIFPEWLKYTDNACSLQNQSGNNNVAIIGDSHARHLFIGLSEIRHDGVAVFPASCALPFVDTASALKPVGALGVRRYAYKLINSAYNYVLKDKNIHYVILAHHPSCSYDDAVDMTNLKIKNSSEVIENGMRRSLSLLVAAGKKVVIVKDNPFLRYPPQACILRPLQFGNTRCSFDKKDYTNDQATKIYNDIIDKVIKDYPTVKVVNLTEKLCDSNKCYVSKGGHILYRDESHLNKYGSRFVAPYINQNLK